jgi:hypothetical protein
MRRARFARWLSRVRAHPWLLAGTIVSGIWSCVLAITEDRITGIANNQIDEHHGGVVDMLHWMLDNLMLVSVLLLIGLIGVLAILSWWETRPLKPERALSHPQLPDSSSHESGVHQQALQATGRGTIISRRITDTTGHPLAWVEGDAIIEMEDSHRSSPGTQSSEDCPDQDRRE